MDKSVRNRRLVYATTTLTVNKCKSITASLGIRVLQPASDFKRTPLFAQPRRLSGEHLAIAKLQFDPMLELYIIRPSSGSWASPLHMVLMNNLGD